MQNIGKEAETEPTAEEYLERLKEGLSVIELVDKIVLSLVGSTTTVRDKLLVLMKIYGVKGDDIQLVLNSCYKYAA